MNYAYDVVVSGRYAYVAAGGAGLLIVDVSSPSLPVELGVYDTPGNARGVAASAGQVLVADERYGLQIVNVVDPLHPAYTGQPCKSRVGPLMSPLRAAWVTLRPPLEACVW